MDNDKLIVVDALFDHIIWHKDEDVGNDIGDVEYRVTVWYVTEIYDDNTEKITVGDRIVVTGTFFEELDSKAPYKIVLKPYIHRTYGLEYDLKGISRFFDLEKEEDIRKFLFTIMTERQLESAYKTYDNPLPYIVNGDIKAITKIKGFGVTLAQKLVEKYERNKDFTKMYTELADFNFSPVFMRKLLKTYRSDDLAIYKVKKDTYSLGFEMPSVGFYTADRIAMQAGISPVSPARVKALINFRLMGWGDEGDSWVTYETLLTDIYNTFDGKDNILEVYTDAEGNVTGNNIKTAVQELIDEKILVVENNENRLARRIYLKKFYNLEWEIARNLRRLLAAPNDFIYDDWEEKLAEAEKKQGFPFTEEQRRGIKMGLDNQVCFIAGGAGCGKSTLVSGILAALKEYTFAQTALSGRAAARLQEVTGVAGNTIHRLLGAQGYNRFTADQMHPLGQKIIIVDEISLVGGEIFLNLLEAIRNGTKLIMLGDMGQLEAVGNLNLAFDMFNSPMIPTIELKEIHRQAAKSGIIATSASIRNQYQITQYHQTPGEFVFGELQDFELDIVEKNQTILPQILTRYQEILNSDLVQGNVMDIEVIVPQRNRGASSVKQLNSLIQNAINPLDGINQIEIGTGDKGWVLRPHDKVMCIKNEYKMPFDAEKDTTRTCDIFNGWVGIVKKIRRYGGREFATIFFPMLKEEVVMDKKSIKELLVLGYCSTVHKFQGSSCKVIICGLDYNTVPTLLTKEMVYTAITRAEKYCCLIAINAALRQAISQTYVSTKQTFLQELLLREDLNYGNQD